MRAVNQTRGTQVAGDVRNARSLWARTKGLLGRKSLGNEEALLIEPCSSIHTFGMAFPIDALFLSRDGRVVHLVKEMKASRISRHVFSARMVLEAPAGTIEGTATCLGDTLSFLP